MAIPMMSWMMVFLFTCLDNFVSPNLKHNIVKFSLDFLSALNVFLILWVVVISFKKVTLTPGFPKHIEDTVIFSIRVYQWVL